MYFITVIRNAAVRWFEKVVLSVVSSLMAALNPFLIWNVLTIVWLLTGNMANFMKNPGGFISQWGLFIAVQSVFPLTLAAMDAQFKALSGEVDTLKEYFVEWFLGLKRIFLKSLLATLVFGVLNFFLFISAAFYLRQTSGQFQLMVMGAIAVLYIYFQIVQWVYLPLLIRREKESPLKLLRQAFGTTVIEFPNVLPLFLVDAILFIGLSFLGGVSVFFYYGFSFALRQAFYESLMDKYNPQPKKSEDDGVEHEESPQARWARMIEDRKKNSEDHKD